MTDDQTAWFTVAQAAAALNRSDRTIRRMIADGRLVSRREGARLYVDLSDHLPAGAGFVLDVADPQEAITRLQAEVDKLTAINERLSSEVDYLRVAHAEALRRIPLLEAPKRRSWWPPWGRGED